MYPTACTILQITRQRHIRDAKFLGVFTINRLNVAEFILQFFG